MGESARIYGANNGAAAGSGARAMVRLPLARARHLATSTAPRWVAIHAPLACIASSSKALQPLLISSLIATASMDVEAGRKGKDVSDDCCKLFIYLRNRQDCLLDCCKLSSHAFHSLYLAQM